jgi:uncharacterized damage-inducible protein DinB
MTPDAHDARPSTLQTLFAYKAWANEELFALLGTIDAAAHATALHSAIRVLNHAHVVDCIFKGHLSGVPHGYPATNTKETPALQSLAAAAREVDAWYVAYVASLPAAGLQEQLRFTFTDGDAGLMTREEMLLHVITHNGYHRGQAGQVMRGAAVAPPRDLYTRFLHISEPERRGRSNPGPRR